MANFFMVPGSGLEFGEDLPVLNRASLARADRLIGLFDTDPELFRTYGSLVVCAGTHQTLPEGVPEPDEQHREGYLMANHLIREGVPHQLVEVEINSTSTFTNVKNTVDLIGRDKIDPESPLRIVSHPNHALRAMFCARKLQIIPRALIAVPTEEQDSALYEWIMRSTARTFMIGAHKPEALVRRDHLMEATHDRLTSTIAGLKKYGKKILHAA